MRTLRDLWAAVEHRVIDGHDAEADLLADLLRQGRVGEARRRVNASETWRQEDLEDEIAHDLFAASYWELDAESRAVVDELVAEERAE